jgi:hypothetical protein
VVGAPKLPSTTSPETRRERWGLEKRKAKKVEKQQNKRGGADLTPSRGDEEAPLARVAISSPLGLPHLPLIQSPSPATGEGGEKLSVSDLAASRSVGSSRAVAREACWEARRTNEELDPVSRGRGEGRGIPDLGEERRRRQGQRRIYTGDGGEMMEAKRPRPAGVEGTGGREGAGR